MVRRLIPTPEARAAWFRHRTESMPERAKLIDFLAGWAACEEAAHAARTPPPCPAYGAEPDIPTASCPECGAAYMGFPPCPSCGSEIPF